MHSTTIKYFKTLGLIHFQNKIPRGGKPKPRGANAPPPPERNPANCYGVSSAYNAYQFQEPRSLTITTTVAI